MTVNANKIPVIESYGPVLQGEGLLIGKPTWFLRLGACDYVCNFCDSMHAVDGSEIAKRATIMSAEEIGNKILNDMDRCPMVTISGGNPALWDLDYAVRGWREQGKKVAVETQGTIWRDWIGQCDYITISPKGPGMINDSEQGLVRFETFLLQVCECCWGTLFDGVSVKIPVFDSSDMEFAEKVLEIIRDHTEDIPLYLSIGNPYIRPPAPLGRDRYVDLMEIRYGLLDKYDKMSRLMMTQHPRLLREAIMLPQMHVLMYGNELGR
jgi:7-carboxy-7-deazaguanine synthase